MLGVLAKYAITFIDLDTGRTVATLEDPNQDRPGCGCFSPDGAQLAVPTQDSYSVHVWDLRRIRAGLKAIDLDWDAPDYPPAPPPHAPLRPFKVIDGQPGRTAAAGAPGRADRAGVGHRPATPEQLAGWVKQLADKDAKTRTEAAQALEEVGPPALKVLDEAAKHPDAAVRRQVKQVQDRIAVAEAVAPRRLSLKFKDVPVAEAVKALARKAGVRLTYTPPAGAAENCHPGTGRGDVPGSAGSPVPDRRPDPCPVNGPDSWHLYRRQAGCPANCSAYAGPMHLQATKLELQSPARLAGEKAGQRASSSCICCWQVRPRRDPWATASRGRWRLCDDAGRSLLPDRKVPALPTGDLLQPAGIHPRGRFCSNPRPYAAARSSTSRSSCPSRSWPGGGTC